MRIESMSANVSAKTRPRKGLNSKLTMRAAKAARTKDTLIFPRELSRLWADPPCGASVSCCEETWYDW